MNKLVLLSLDQLAQCCSTETAKYLQRQSSDSCFGFELMRRALAEENHDAFRWVCDIYARQVRAWVHHHSKFLQTNEEADYFVNAAFTAFFCALRGERFARFSSLAPIMAYLKACIHTSIMQYLRDQQAISHASIDAATEIASSQNMDEHLQSNELWEHIATLLPDMRSRKLAYMALVQDLKPRQIVAAMPKEWYSERDVSVALYRIRQLLRNDGRLRHMLGLHMQELTLEHAA